MSLKQKVKTYSIQSRVFKAKRKKINFDKLIIDYHILQAKNTQNVLICENLYLKKCLKNKKGNKFLNFDKFIICSHVFKAKTK